MASFPPIARPCPLRFLRMPEPGRDWCTFCEKRVHDLDRMGDTERDALLARGGDVCVAYRVMRQALTLVAGGGVAAALATGCGDTPPAPASRVDRDSRAPVVRASAAESFADTVMVAGGIGPHVEDREGLTHRTLADLRRELAEFSAPPEVRTPKEPQDP